MVRRLSHDPRNEHRLRLVRSWLDRHEVHGRTPLRSVIASASAASFFCRLTNGFT